LDTTTTTFEREFRIGDISQDYKEMIANRSKTDFVDDKYKPRFKIVVEQGEVFFQCVDPFEDVFEVKRDLVEHLELTEILDPFLFESHKDIINALFLIYFQLSNDYVDKFYTKQKASAASEFALTGKADSDFIDMNELATRKLRIKYKLTDE
jgi:hypothetical protein